LKKVFFHDNTLHDGKPFTGIVFNEEGKIEIARALNDFGIHFCSCPWMEKWFAALRSETLNTESITNMQGGGSQ
jgi:isopropylmalate/homocitrate/citramalate synthase